MPPTILDDVDVMHKIDKSNMLAYCTQAANHYIEAAKNAKKIKLDYSTPKNIIISGMGGSAIGGELLKDFTRSTAKIPVEINREYKLPSYADKKSLVILASYSGNTEETLGSFLDALKRKCMIFCISSGGTLIEYAEKLNVPHLEVQGGMPPRAALPYMLVPLLYCAEKLNLAPSFSKDLSQTTAHLEKISKENDPNKVAGKNFSKTLALRLNESMPVIYGFGIFRGVALRWKQQFNENAKIPAKWEYFSELNHNETMGWENPKELSKCYAIILIRDKAEPTEIRSRIETTKTLMQPPITKILEVWSRGKSDLLKILSTILVGDFTSIYLAFLRNVDPTPVNTVETMKQRIERNGVKKRIIEELEALAKRA